MGEGNGTPLQYSCLENPTDRGAWWAVVQGVRELDTTEATYHTCAHNTDISKGLKISKSLITMKLIWKQINTLKAPDNSST